MSTTNLIARREAVQQLLAKWRPVEMTPETVPEYLRELSPEEYTRRRNDENREALRSLEFHGDWIKMAASHLHCAGSMAPEFGSYGHSCLIMAEALMKTRDAILALESSPTPVREDASRSPVSEERAALHRCERIAEMKVEQCLQRTDGRGLNDAKDTLSKIRAVVQRLALSSPQPQASLVSEDASRSPVMTVIEPEQWEPCSPAYLAAGGSCDAPRVWNAEQLNHWHPKVTPTPQPQASLVSEECDRTRRVACTCAGFYKPQDCPAHGRSAPHPVAEPVSKTPDSDQVAGGGND